MSPTEAPPNFAARGFVVLPGLLDPGTLQALRAAVDASIDRLVAQSGMTRDRWLALIQQVPALAGLDPTFATFQQYSPLVASARAALQEPGARCLSSSLVLKPPGCSVHLVWHRDRPLWRLDPPDGKALAAWVALDGVGKDSGGLRYIPGSHLPGPPTGDEPDATSPLLAPGDVLLHHADVAHSSGPNRSDAWRRGLVLVFLGAGVRSLA
jgi:phytanoyl-CoA hydroxylase